MEADENNLPFKVGDEAEARSFQSGFRGAWFRCKIKRICKNKGYLRHRLEHYDFPDDKPTWLRLYQVPYHLGRSNKNKELMLRPRYPRIYKEQEMPNVDEISEVAVIVQDAWKVGDLVDWFTSGCYWTGRITCLLGDGKAQLDLLPKPLGEGESSSDILLEDIRPSLDWSPENGWTMPIEEGDAGRPSVRLIKPLKQVSSKSALSDEKNRQRVDIRSRKTSRADTDSGHTPHEKKNQERGDGSSKKTGWADTDCGLTPGEKKNQECEEISSKKTSRADADSGQAPDEKKNQENENISSKKTSRADTDSRQTPAEPVAEDDLSPTSPLKKATADGKGTTLRSMHSDTMEAAVLDLEEYLNKVKWLKGILESGISSTDASRSKWEFVDPNADSST